ncbi:ankyrin repeat domain-containing protein 16-like [Chelonus insularis]|uniref:ankyrin repeat domain-containing protein 16-like n=1 Tax=Chelonus insularis TaxID=460826 RepID=UPI00158AC005|nr:ankyrin repeat domain-containing protein 16-like [Chelonus insularis]
MTKNVKNLSKEFLHATSRADLDKLKDLCNQHDIKDWTFIRHEITGDTALHIAAREGYLEIVKFLCENWKNHSFKVVNVVNKDTKRPLHEAAQFAKSDIVEYLIDNGAEVDAIKRADWTPLMLACTKDGPDAIESIKKLIKAGANLSLRNKDGWMPLHIASRVGNANIIKLLLEVEPELINVSSKNGRTALHIAAFHGHLDAIHLLLSTEPNLLHSPDYSGLLPIHEAVKSKDYKVFEYLIKCRADVKKTDFIGHTILHIAALCGNIPVIEYILENKLIEIDCKDNFGATPLNIAQKNNMHSVIEFLEQYKT